MEQIKVRKVLQNIIQKKGISDKLLELIKTAFLKFILTSYENITASYFQHFKLLFFQAYLHFGTSNLLSAYSKTSLVFVISILSILSSLEIQTRVIQIKYTTSFFNLSENKQPPNLPK